MCVEVSVCVCVCVRVCVCSFLLYTALHGLIVTRSVCVCVCVRVWSEARSVDFVPQLPATTACEDGLTPLVSPLALFIEMIDGVIAWAFVCLVTIT